MVCVAVLPALGEQKLTSGGESDGQWLFRFVDKGSLLDFMFYCEGREKEVTSPVIGIDGGAFLAGPINLKGLYAILNSPWTGSASSDKWVATSSLSRDFGLEPGQTSAAAFMVPGSSLLLCLRWSEKYRQLFGGMGISHQDYTVDTCGGVYQSTAGQSDSWYDSDGFHGSSPGVYSAGRVFFDTDALQIHIEGGALYQHDAGFAGFGSSGVSAAAGGGSISLLGRYFSPQWHTVSFRTPDFVYGLDADVECELPAGFSLGLLSWLKRKKAILFETHAPHFWSAESSLSWSGDVLHMKLTAGVEQPLFYQGKPDYNTEALLRFSSSPDAGGPSFVSVEIKAAREVGGLICDAAIAFDQKDDHSAVRGGVDVSYIVEDQCFDLALKAKAVWSTLEVSVTGEFDNAPLDASCIEHMLSNAAGGIYLTINYPE